METARALEPVAPVEEGYMVAIHSLRGGTGCSSLAVNLSVGLAGLWPRSTILLDLNMTAGQVALMLNMTLRRTWSDVAHFKAGEMDKEALDSIISLHESGLSLIAAPTLPTEADALQGENLGTALHLLKQKYEYILADLSHDFGDAAIQAMDAADIILIIATPDMASIRAISAAMDTYSRLGYPTEKLKLVLNATFPHAGLPKEKIESALGISAIVTIPYVEDVFVEGINYGRPPVLYKPQESISALLEDFAFYLSKDAHKKTKPQTPTEAWTRVYKRFSERRK
jgi:pilus assembly protein CpaE